jgi:O-antigen ligase
MGQGGSMRSIAPGWGTFSGAAQAQQLSVAHPSALFRGGSSQAVLIGMLAVFAGHAALGMAIYSVPEIAGFHAVIVFGVGLHAVARKTPVTVTCVAAYIAGTEVLWRMVEAPLFYEIGKYSVCVLFALALLRMGSRARWRLLPLVYFLILLPSALLVLENARLGTHDVRKLLSFNFSGPLALCMSVWFLSQLKLTDSDLRRILLAFIAPSIAVASATLLATYSAQDLVFTSESNLATSGGFGPNQVAQTLGIAAMLSFLSAIDRTIPLRVRAVYAAAVVLLAMQSAMTFSRGGLYTAALALIAGAPFFLSARRMRQGFVAMCAFAIAAAAVVVIPHLQTFTSGALRARFSDTDPTSRIALIRDDLRLWAQHPVLGVGPGAAKEHRETVRGSAHTEYTRNLAEHGVFGLISLLALAAMFVQALLAPGDRATRGLRVALLAASALSMTTAAMRIAAYPFMFGLAHARQQTLGRERSGLEA